jgi:hypothetical protein
MSKVTIQLPDWPKKEIEAPVARKGRSVSQFSASWTKEKYAVVLMMNYLDRESAAGQR